MYHLEEDHIKKLLGLLVHLGALGGGGTQVMVSPIIYFIEEMIGMDMRELLPEDELRHWIGEGEEWLLDRAMQIAAERKRERAEKEIGRAAFEFYASQLKENGINPVARELGKEIYTMRRALGQNGQQMADTLGLQYEEFMSIEHGIADLNAVQQAKNQIANLLKREQQLTDLLDGVDLDLE